MNVPETFKIVAGGFYQDALEYGGHTVKDCVGMGVARVRQSECPALLAWLDTILVAEPVDVLDAWRASGCEYVWDDPEFTRDLFRSARDLVAERVATGHGGRPG